MRDAAPILITPDLLRTIPLPSPDPGAGKDARGRVLVIGGSASVPGAALLSSLAALRVGAGKVAIATCARNATAMGMALPEALVKHMAESPGGGIDPDGFDTMAELLARCDAVLIGPGLTDRDATAALTAKLLDHADGPALVIDAEAIVTLDQHRELLRTQAGRIVITPHAGEMAGLLGISREDVEADPLTVAASAANDFGVLVALKGACTHVVGAGAPARLCTAGNVGLATSGSGDVLAGFIAGLAARGAALADATAWGVFVHATAGERLARTRGPIGYLARELPELAPGILAELSS